MAGFRQGVVLFTEYPTYVRIHASHTTPAANAGQRGFIFVPFLVIFIIIVVVFRFTSVMFLRLLLMLLLLVMLPEFTCS